jgi:tetratricopeptide (TPR) repeat protein
MHLSPEQQNLRDNFKIVFNATPKENIESRIGVCKQYLLSDPNFEEAHYIIGNIYYKEGQYDEALQHFKEAIRINPKNDKAYNNLGCTYFQKIQFQEAINCLKESLKISPTNETARESIKFIESLITKPAPSKMRRSFSDSEIERRQEMTQPYKIV